MATALTSLEVAAKFGCEEIFEILYKAGAEDSSWRVSTATQEDSLLEIPSEAPLFALSVSSPMHQAIASGHRSMLDKLLNAYNYCPNYRPLVTPTVGVPAVTWQSRACVNALATCGHATVGRTVLGHTLLHVAALPLTGYQVARNKPVIERSIHCARTHSRPPYINEEKQYKHVPMTDAEQVAQLATIALLLRWGGFDVQAQDIDGNTALHYLAATLNIGDETVELVREMGGSEDVWESTSNRWGLTPKQLAEEKLADNCKDA
ncbi:ankyrin repeat-containing domain protein [Aspergillus parasiticus]|uniref:Ankyrin repeat-containing domain protein n=1 Tax=Aspergillus parasiticus TaxID=5067 RepID=A0A5N6DSQ7_ASPPA|nr:ankyrin repeat-containing domain protein [Aspergillus parasiticus]